ncbi:Chromosome partition protein Smc [Anoxybacillus sp. BCO1]|nr:Chromosome partition protein Smc [Anoxybacillus sp. BCO1]
MLSAYGPKAEAEIERLKSEYIDLVHEQATLKNERTHTEAQLQKNEEKQRQLIAANDEHIRAYEQIVQQWEQKQQLVHQLQQRIAEQEEAVKTKEQQLAVQKEQYRKKEATLYEAYQYVQKMKIKKRKCLKRCNKNMLDFPRCERSIKSKRSPSRHSWGCH